MMKLKKKIRSLYSFQKAIPFDILAVPTDDDRLPRIWVELETVNSALEPYGIKFSPDTEN